jgi:hypothetical protein
MEACAAGVDRFLTIRDRGIVLLLCLVRGPAAR